MSTLFNLLLVSAIFTPFIAAIAVVSSVLDAPTPEDKVHDRRL